MECRLSVPIRLGPPCIPNSSKFPCLVARNFQKDDKIKANLVTIKTRLTVLGIIETQEFPSKFDFHVWLRRDLPANREKITAYSRRTAEEAGEGV